MLKRIIKFCIGLFLLPLGFGLIKAFIGQKLTHAFWSLIFGGKVKGFRVSKSGGSVRLTKSNILVTLAPYFFPIYTFLILFIYFLLRIFLKIYPDLFGFLKEFQLEIALLFLVGFTLAFHLALTFDSLHTHQPDIYKTGVFFSLVLILMANVVTITLVLKLISPGKISLGTFFRESLETTTNMWNHLKRIFVDVQGNLFTEGQRIFHIV